MKKLIITLLILSHYAWGTDTAPTPSPKVSTSKKPLKFKKNVSMEFEGRSVDGNVVSPDSADVQGDKNIKFEPLLEGRKDFKREFKRSSGVTR